MLDLLIADDERPALDELEFLLRRDPRAGAIHRAMSGSAALAALGDIRVDAVLLDIHMPGLSGIELARALATSDRAPALVFVTADDERAVEAFDLHAVDYLLKPVREERLQRTLSRLVERRTAPGEAPAGIPDEMIAVTVGSTVRRVRRSDVRYVQAQGDYARLHTDDASYLVRAALSDLEAEWEGAGFLRIHRSYLVAIDAVGTVDVASPPSVTVAGAQLPVSRRMLPTVREVLASRSPRAGR